MTYTQSQLEPILPDEFGVIRVKFMGIDFDRNNIQSNWLNLTLDQFRSIREILETKNEPENL